MNDATYGEMNPQRTKDSQSQRVSDKTDGPQSACSTSQKRTANVTQDSSGNPLGAAIWLNADELDAIGVGIGNAEAVEIFVEDGDLQICSSEEGRK